MNRFYSVSPKIFTNATEVGVVLNSFGFDKGRFLAALPKSFLRELFDTAAGFSELEGKRVRALVEKNKHALLKLGLPYDGNKSWLENSLQLIEQNSLDGVLCNEDVGSEKVFTLDDVADGELPISDGARDYATAENIIKYMSVILKTSLEVFFVDPYFSLGKAKYIKFLQALLQHPESKDTNYVFFCKQEHFATRESFDSLAQRHLQPHMVQGCCVTVYPLADEAEMHGRYVFNIHGGVDYDKGFQVDESVRVDFSAMPRALHSSYFDEYSELMRKQTTVYRFQTD